MSDDNLSWPSSSAIRLTLKEIMGELGYDAIKEGRSCFDSRNCFVYVKKGVELTQETALQAAKDFEKAREMVQDRKYQNFDKRYNDASDDFNKVYAVVETGGTHGYTEEINRDKYDEVALKVIAFTADHRVGREHTFRALIIDKEKMLNDKRQFVTMLIPKDMIGTVVGKGGDNIKRLSQKYGKTFNVLDADKVKEIEKAVDDYVKNAEAKSDGKPVSTIELGQYISETYKGSKEAKYVKRQALLKLEKQKNNKGNNKTNGSVLVAKNMGRD